MTFARGVLCEKGAKWLAQLGWRTTNQHLQRMLLARRPEAIGQPDTRMPWSARALSLV